MLHVPSEPSRDPMAVRAKRRYAFEIPVYLTFEICSPPFHEFIAPYKTGIGLTTGFIGSHTVTVYTLYTRSSL
jgi:hypothetical protein